MKKMMTVVLCLCILFAGCSKKSKGPESFNLPDNAGTDRTETVKQDTTDNNTQANSDQQQDNQQALGLDKEWSKVKFVETQKPDFNAPVVEPDVKPYVIKKDLSNIENIDQFSGFTEEQKRMLAENGFVVLPSDDTRMHYVYDSNAYLKVPNFITSDSVLNLYHQFYNKSLMFIENEYLYDYLDRLTGQMLDKSVKLMDYITDDDLKSLQEKNIVYFLVARMLLLETPDVDIDINAGLYDIAREEYRLIDKAEGFVKSPLFGFDIDYSQFTIRGHYTFNENMGRYFRTMMWLGIAPLPFFDDNGNMLYENIYQALLMAYATFIDTDDICSAELWNNIYRPTEQYVGVSDDVNVFMMNGLRLDVFGNIEDPNVFNDEEYKDKLTEAVLKLPEPKIQGKFIMVSTPTEKQFRYMGQRYILDSYIMQELTEPFFRPVPSALDTMGVLGSGFAEDLLFNYYKPQEIWPEYKEKYNELKEEVAGYGLDTWSENLYNGWLWAIQENLTEFDKDSGMPYFMTNDAWKAKSLNTSLGSYTELKHDTVLYGKQSAAEGGDASIIDIDAHYVEPNINLYCKLLYLTDYTVKVLKERNMLNRGLENAASAYSELLKFLIECSAKELQNEKLTEEEYDRLYYYGAVIENISLTLAYNLSEDREITDLLVTDIATVAVPAQYLSLGTGFFDHIYVVVPVEGKLYLTRGAVYSTYEFISDKRLTDEEWWELNGIKIVKSEFADYPEFTQPSELLPKQAEWVKKFKSFKNNVSISTIEVEFQ